MSVNTIPSPLRANKRLAKIKKNNNPLKKEGGIV